MKNLTIKKARQGLIKKEFSAVELAKFYLDKIKKENKKYNDFISLTEKLALDQAKEVDKKISQREKLEPIEGIPIAVKDNILVEDFKTTAGSKILENYIAPYSATVIDKLKNAGAVILGKTNLDEFAMGSSTEQSAFGPVKNPIDISRVPGGSSGGSAVAVAADHCIAALGSDTGGSIRQPASFCGIVGFKPSYGMVSRYGLIAMASSLDQIGPITKNVEDAQLIYNVIRGKDKMDLTTIDSNPENYKLKTKNLIIGIPEEYFKQGLNSEIKKQIEKVIEKLEKNKYKIKKISLPCSEYSLAVYYIIMPAEVSANLARYDGIRYGYSVGSKNLLDNYIKTRAKGFGKEVRRRIILGTYVLSAGYRDAYYNKAQKVRALIKQDFDKVFSSGIDVILTPTTPTTAFKLGEKQDPLTMYLSDVYTASVNLAGLSAISVPAGEVKNLPVGVQFIAPQFKDNFLLSFVNNYGK